MSKQSLLLAALNTNRTVTHATALIDYKIPNLTAVIGDLRRLGFDIECTTARDVSGIAYSKWRLKQPKPKRRSPTPPPVYKPMP